RRSSDLVFTRVLAPPSPAAASHQALPLPARQPAQAATQLIERVRAQRFALAPQHRKAHRAIEWRQVRGLEPAGLAFLEAQPYDAHSTLDLVVHGDAVAV